MIINLILSLVSLAYWILFFLFIGRMVLSFIRVDPYDPTWGFIPRKVEPAIHGLTEPILQPVRRLLPPQGGLDFSPLIVLLGIWALRILIVSILT